MAGNGKVDSFTVETRVDAVRVLLLKGQEDTPRLVQDIATQFGVNTRQAYNYVAKAKKQIAEIGEIDRAYRLAEQLAVRRDIRRRANAKGDYRAELLAAQDEAKLLGLYPADRHSMELTGSDGGDIKIQVVDYRRGLAALAPEDGE
jgi:hypothetical protein